MLGVFANNGNPSAVARTVFFRIRSRCVADPVRNSFETRENYSLHRDSARLSSFPAWTPRVRSFVEAEKRKLTNYLTITLRCHRNVWSVRQWSLRWAVRPPGLPL